MTRLITMALPFLVAGGILVQSVIGQTNYGAVSSGNWNSGGTWTPGGGPPSATDNAFVGSTTPSGSAATAAVTLTGNQTIAALALGNDTGTNGTLSLSSGTLFATSINIGQFGGIGVVTYGSGHFETVNFNVFNNNNQTLDSADRITNLNVRSGSTVTTSGAMNVSTQAFILDQGSLLNMGANLSLSGDLDIRGTGANVATVNANGFDITARDIYIGRFGAAGAITNDGAIVATRHLEVSNNTFSLDADDSVGDTVRATNNGVLNLHANTAAQNASIFSGGTINTVATGNLGNSVLLLDQNSLLNMGANLSLSGDLDIRGTGANVATVNANGFDITARDIYIGRFGAAGAITNDGAIVATRHLEVSNNTFSLDADDSVGDTVRATNNGVLNLHANTAAQNASIFSGGTINTVATGNLNTSVLLLDQNSLLNMGAHLTLSGDLDIRGTGANVATVNANGFNISARDIFIGQLGAAGAIANDGVIAASRNLEVSNNTFSLDADDSVVNTVRATSNGVLNLHANTAAQNASIFSGGTINTVATGNLNTSVLLLNQNSLLNMGANLTLSGDLDIRGTGTNVATVNANGFNISARDIFIGQLGAAGAIANDGVIAASRNLEVSNNTFSLDADDIVVNTVRATSDGVLTLHANTAAQNATMQSGGTINSVATGNLSTSVLVSNQNSLFNMGADLALSGDLDIRGTGANVATVNANGNNVTADNVYVGHFANSGLLLNTGVLIANSLQLDSSPLTLEGGDDFVNALLQLQANSTLTVSQSPNELTGLTLNGNSLNILDTSVLDLQFDTNLVFGLDWTFRWANPGVGDRVATINALIGSGRITFTSPASVSVFDNGDGYTYIGYLNSIPEPSAGLLLGIIGLAVAGRRRSRVAA